MVGGKENLRWVASKEATSLDASVGVQKVARRSAPNDSTRKTPQKKDTPQCGMSSFLRGAIGEVDRSRDVGSVGGARRAVGVLPAYRRVLATLDARSILASSSASPTVRIERTRAYRPYS